MDFGLPLEPHFFFHFSKICKVWTVTINFFKVKNMFFHCSYFFFTISANI